MRANEFIVEGVAEGKVINTYLWHGSRQKIPMLEPRQSVDTGGAAGSNQNAIYATSDPKVAIAMGLTTPGSDTGMFPNDPQMVLFSGKIRKGEYVYLHKLPFNGPDGKPQFVQGGNSREFHSIPGVEGIKPIEIKEIPVNKYLNLIRKATPADLKLRKKYMKKQGVAEGISNDMSTKDMIAYLRQHHDTNLHQDYLNHINTFSKFVLQNVPVNSIKTDLPKLDREKVEQYKQMDFSKAPPIVMGGGYILDGYHRANVAKALGIPTIKAYVGVQGVTEGSLNIDVPNEEWLQDAIDYAKSKSPDRNGLPYMGKTTATARYVNVPVDILKTIPGMRKEQANVRHNDLAAIMKIMNTTGKLPLGSHTGEEYKPFINVAYDGSAWVNEGNHRIMAAAKLGWDTLPIEISYFDGGERIKSGPMYPPKIGL
jgi:hypothetical protein